MADHNDDDLVADLLKTRPVLNNGADCVIVVDNVPKVDAAKLDKLMLVLKKVFAGFGELQENGIHMPRDAATGMTKGFAFLEFKTAPQAQQAAKKLQGYRLDKMHEFETCTLADFERYEKVSDSYQPPKPEDYSERENLRSWLQHERSVDQFVLRYGPKSNVLTDICWNGHDEAERIHTRPNWSDSSVLWSPRGTYLATFHKQGIALWGGSAFGKIVRFNHPGVKLVDFSPKEDFLVTWSNEASDDPADPQSLIVWDVRTGNKLRGFASGPKASWPAFRWSHDDAFFARIFDDALSIYETPSMRLLDKKSIKVAGLKDFAWSPTDNILSYWVAESGNNPARVVLLAVPSREERSVKNLFNVNDCKLYWQASGDHLAVKVERTTKTKKSTYTNFEIFRMREKGIPVDVLEIKDTILAFAWEPVGTKFALIHGEGVKTAVSFYNTDDAASGGKISLVKTLEKKQVNQIFWSPRGQHVVLAALRTNSNNVLEFWDTKDMVCTAVGEHLMATDLEWDPTGRYVATYVSNWLQSLENGYALWTVTGRNLYRRNLEALTQFLWRPRPPALLTNEQLKAVKKKLKDLSAKFDRQDTLAANKASKEVIERRRALVAQYEAYRKAKKAVFDATAQARAQLRPQAQEQLEETEQIVEVFISETVEPVN
ncbi:hypothetical protein CAOG_09132 [Capsaspora owczarzaki ATCC 30864]|uniref:Eukaryotic translation initiation factor 3 subunit B n=1 Tax=Capsaspora owczarzaki (strain ATCC 30864) TaxID=595528 RepID=A0A0D2URY2_CAPO3|nr:hypothetical protein CAOG_09132 [Capsaspora owczarzaki ATCC 30864]KJE97726.1 hypothetical protein CAOG_009132 [Capsaspora owczarzaki ATCC 30864]|eukprot:XP_011270842.1 hypothetical protein CAOG_09132 [Capsaspora owczarzaki ATCC 30864]